MGKNTRYLVGDFETTVYAGQVHTEVWASACVELFTEDVQIFHSIDDTFDYIVSLDCPVVIYYHNLKFDGQFWLYYLLVKKKFKQAVRHLSETINDVEWLSRKDMPNNSIAYSISEMGMWLCQRLWWCNVSCIRWYADWRKCGWSQRP